MVAITINRALSRKRSRSVACTVWEVVRRKEGVDMAYIRKTKDEYQGVEWGQELSRNLFHIDFLAGC